MLSIGPMLSVKPGVVALSLVSLIVMMGSSMATPSLALYAGHLGANELLIGAAIAGFAIGRLIFDLPSGFLADRLGLHRTMILGLGILVGAALLAGLAPSYWILFSARILEGVGSSIYVSAAVSFILLSSESSKRATTMGTYQSILMLGPIVGPIVGAPIAVLYGYNSPYLAFAVMMAVALAVISLFSRKGRFRLEDRNDSGESQNSVRMSNLSFYINTAGVATFGFAFLRAGIYSTGMPLFAYGSLALTVYDVGIILTASSLASLAASYFSGRVTRVYGMKKPLFAAILFSALLTATIPLTSSFGQLLVIMMLMGVSSGFFGQSIAWAAEQIEARVRKVGAVGISSEAGSPARLHSHLTRGIGFNRMIGDLGLILGPLFVGFVVSMFSSDPLSWFIAFGATSVVIGVTSLLIIQPLQLRKESH